MGSAVKTCSVCKKELELSNFSPDKNTGGYKAACKSCRNKASREHDLKKKNGLIKPKLVTRDGHKYCSACKKEKLVEEFDIQRRSKSGRMSHCKECRKATTKSYYEKNTERIKKFNNKRYHSCDKEKLRITRQARNKIRLKEDVVYKLSRNIRRAIWGLLKGQGWIKNSKYINYLGLDSFDELKQYLTPLLSGEMTWENYGSVWDIDHIVPLSSAKTEEDAYRLSHYTNLAPKLSLENRVMKRGKFIFKDELYVLEIPSNIATEYHTRKHYLHRPCPIEVAFGLFQKSNDVMVGVCTFATPFSPGLKRMVCGEEEKNNILELNRLVVDDKLPTNTESWFVAKCLKAGLHKDIIVSFADSVQEHTGIIYQALNFIYTGKTEVKKEFTILGKDKHSASLAMNNTAEELRSRYGDSFRYRDRSSKHRYIYFVRNKDRYMKKLKLQILPYPQKKGTSF